MRLNWAESGLTAARRTEGLTAQKRTFAVCAAQPAPSPSLSAGSILAAVRRTSDLETRGLEAAVRYNVNERLKWGG